MNIQNIKYFAIAMIFGTMGSVFTMEPQKHTYNVTIVQRLPENVNVVVRQSYTETIKAGELKPNERINFTFKDQWPLTIHVTDADGNDDHLVILDDRDMNKHASMHRSLQKDAPIPVNLEITSRKLVVQKEGAGQ